MLTDTQLFLYLTLPPLFLESIIMSAAITSSSAGILAPEVRWLDYTFPLLLDWAQLLQVVLCKLIIKILRRMGSDWNPVGSPGLLPFEGYQWSYQSELLFQTPFWNNSILVTNSSYVSESTLWKEGLTSSLWAQVLPTSADLDDTIGMRNFRNRDYLLSFIKESLHFHPTAPCTCHWRSKDIK